jgi:hypothetical protein
LAEGAVRVLAEAVVQACLADWLEVVVAVQQAAGAVTQAAAVVGRAVAATLGVVVAVVVAGVCLQLVLSVQRHGSFLYGSWCQMSPKHTKFSYCCLCHFFGQIVFLLFVFLFSFH